MKKFFVVAFMAFMSVMVAGIVVGCATRNPHPPNYGETRVISTQEFFQVSADGLTTQKVSIVTDGYRQWAEVPFATIDSPAAAPSVSGGGGYDYGRSTAVDSVNVPQLIVVERPILYMRNSFHTAGSRDPYIYRTWCPHGIRAYGCEYCGTLVPHW